MKTIRSFFFVLGFLLVIGFLVLLFVPILTETTFDFTTGIYRIDPEGFRFYAELAICSAFAGFASLIGCAVLDNLAFNKRYARAVDILLNRIENRYR